MSRNSTPEKIELTIADLHAASQPSEAFSLILQEKEGERYVPIIIGMNEARAILVELNQSPTHRPLTHELFVSLSEKANCRLTEVVITYFKNGIYFAQLCLTNEKGTPLYIDARPSDAIAIALKCKVPFFMATKSFEENCVLEEDHEQGIHPQEYFELSDFLSEDETLATEDYINQRLKEMSTEELHSLLEGAIETEDFELAEKIQKEINRRRES